jgi:lysophospholipase L1-like esterase
MSRSLFVPGALPLCALMFAGACGGDGMPAVLDTSPHSYDADDPNIAYSGRIDFGNPKQPKFSLGETSETIRFMGTGASVLVKDEYRYGKFHSYYDAVVDEQLAMKIDVGTDASMFTHEVASNLPYREHTLTVVRRTEANIGIGYFAGFEIAGTILPPPAAPAHKLEFIGDSITAAAGVDATNGSADCASDEGYAIGFMDADKSYGAVAARMLDAEPHIFGVGGIGLIRNYNMDASKGDVRPMPAVYDLRLPQLADTSAANTWDTTKWVPDAVVIALGTNDFSPGSDPPMTSPGVPTNARPIMQVSDFVAAYVAFIDTLRGFYPSAHVFVVSSPMLGDGWPASFYTSATDQKNALTMVVSHYGSAGDFTVHKFFVTPQSGTGCGTHPDADQQAATGAELAAFIKTTMGW